MCWLLDEEEPRGASGHLDELENDERGVNGVSEEERRRTDPEAPLPCELLSHDAAENWAGAVSDKDGRLGESWTSARSQCTLERGEGSQKGRTLVLAAVFERHDVRDDDEDEREEAAAADALESSKDDELQHRLGERARQRADEEDGDAGEEGDLAAKDIAEAAPDGLNGARGKEVRRGDERRRASGVEGGRDVGQCGTLRRIEEVRQL